MVRRRGAGTSGGPEMPERLYEGYVFDLDGTIYLGDELLPGAKRLILKLRELGKRVIFLSNNATKDPKMYAEKLGKLGLKTPDSEIVNTVVTMTEWLLLNHPDATVFPISEEPLKNALSEAGIRISEDPEEIDIVIASSRSPSTPSGSTDGRFSSLRTPTATARFRVAGDSPTRPPSSRP